MAKITEGEWKVTDTAFARWSTYRKSVTGARVFVTMGLGQVAEVHGDTEEEAQANAHLISASPDMYKALEELSEYIKFNMGNAAPIYDKAIKALSKAKGE